MHNPDTVLDKAPGQEAFCTVSRLYGCAVVKTSIDFAIAPGAPLRQLCLKAVCNLKPGDPEWIQSYLKDT